MTTRSPHAHRLTPESLPVSRGMLWFALLGGGVAWTLQLLLAYAVSEFGCLSGLGGSYAGGLTIVAWLLIGVSVGAVALALAAVLASAKIRRKFRGDRGDETTTEGVRTVAFGGDLALITNLVFLLVILAQSVPIFFFLRTC